MKYQFFIDLRGGLKFESIFVLKFDLPKTGQGKKFGANAFVHF